MNFTANSKQTTAHTNYATHSFLTTSGRIVLWNPRNWTCTSIAPFVSNS